MKGINFSKFGFSIKFQIYRFMFRFHSFAYCMHHRPNMPQFLVFITLALQFSTLIYAQVPELVIPIGHTRTIRTLDFSSDFKYILSGSDDNSIKIWDVSTQREIRTIRIHKESVREVKFLPGDSVGFSSDWDGMNTFNVLTGERIQNYPWRNSIFECDISSDGKKVLLADNNSLVMFDLQKKYITDSLKLPARPEGLAIAHDMKSVAVGLRNGQVSLFGYPGMQEKILADSGNTDATTVAYSFDGKYLGAGFGNGAIKIWNIESGEMIYEYNLHMDGVTKIIIKSEPLIIVSAAYDRKIFLVEKEPNTYRTIATDYDWLSDVAASEDLTSFVYGRMGKSMPLFTKGEWKYLEGKGSGQRSIEFDRESNRLFTSDNQGIAVWDIKRGGGVKRITNKGLSYATDIAPSGKYILAGSFNGNVYEYNLEHPDSFLIYRGAAEPINDVLYSPDGTLVTAVSKDSLLQQWHIDSTWAHVYYKTTNEYFNAAAFSKNGKHLAAGSADGSLEYWTFDYSGTSKIIRAHRGIISDIIFSEDDRIMATTGVDGKIKLWESLNGEYINTIMEAPNYLRNLAWRKDKRKIYAGDLDKNIYVTDIETGDVEILSGHDHWIEDLALIKNDSILVSSSLDGTTIWWETETGKELVKLIPLDSMDWVAVMPDGRFDGSQNGIAMMYYVQGMEFIPLEAYFTIYYTPGLLAGIFDGSIKVNESKNSIINLKPAPVVSLTTPKSKSIKSGEFKITVTAEDRGGGIKSIKLFTNGKLWANDVLSAADYSKTGKLNKVYTIELIADTNIIKVIADNTDGLESAPFEQIIIAQGTKPAVNLFILGIGINNYKNEKYNLTGAVNDIKKLSTAAGEKGKGIFASVNTTLIENNKATKQNILSQIKEIKSKIKSTDVFILFYSGHGVVHKEKGTEDFYFVLHDVVNMYGGGDELVNKSISSTELKNVLASIKANKQLVVIDACQAGGVLESFSLRGAEEEKAITTLARSSGVFLLASSSKDQFAKEVGELGMGIYSYSLLEAINCLGDFNEDGVIQVREIEQYTRKRLAELTKKYKLSPQYPVSWMVLQDFPIAVCK